MTPYFQDDLVTLYHGDAMEIMPSLPQADAVVTDPPYGETSLEWDVWPAGWPTLAASIAPQLWCTGSLRMFFEHLGEFADWKLAQDVVWEKHNGSGFDADRFKRVHEYAVHWYRGDWKALPLTPVKVAGEPRPSARIRQGGQAAHRNESQQRSYEYTAERMARSVIYARSCHGYATNETQKPEALIAPLVEYSVPPGGLVVDPFAGSGTTLKVAATLGRRAIGIEKRRNQCDAIVARLSQQRLAL